MKDSEFLNWIADRMVYVHGENPWFDYMQRLRQIAKDGVAHKHSVNDCDDCWEIDRDAYVEGQRAGYDG